MTVSHRTRLMNCPYISSRAYYHSHTGRHKLEGINFYDWQIRAYNHIRNNSAVLSAPTGSGKTLVAYLWAGILNYDGSINTKPEAAKIIFTAPIKALSNERYLDLRKMGLDVGIETGDFKDEICQTSESKTNC